MDFTIVCCNDMGYDRIMFEHLLNDLSGDARYRVLYRNVCMPKVLKRVLFSGKLGEINTRYLKYEIDKIIKRLKDKYGGINLVLFNVSAKYYSAEKLEKLKKAYPMLKIYLWMIDPLDMVSSTNALKLIDKHNSIFDGVWINDDSEKTLLRAKAKFEYTPYSVINSYKDKLDSVQYDLYWGDSKKQKSITDRVGKCV